MATETTYPTILLPGPVAAAYTVTISSTTSTPAGRDISKSVTRDGSGQTQVIEYLQDNYRDWHPYVGEEIFVDYGKGPLAYYLDERFGVFFLESVARYRA